MNHKISLPIDSVGFIQEANYRYDDANGIHVASVCYYADHYDDSLFNDYDLAFPESLSRAVVKRKSEFLAGRIVAKIALKHLDIIDFAVHIGEHRQPLWPPGIVGSISHTSDRAMCVLSRDEHNHSIGIDIEQWLDKAVAQNIKYQLVDADEESLLGTLKVSFEHALTVVFFSKRKLI